MKIGQRIKLRRKELKMSQAQLARKLNYKSRSSINKIELGYNDITQSKVAAFAQALKTSPAYLMGWEEESDDERYDLCRISPYTDASSVMVVRESANELLLPGHLFSSRDRYFYCYMPDNAMNSDQINRDDLLIFAYGKKLKNGDIGFFAINEDQNTAVICRRFYRDKGKGTITLLAANSHFQPLTFVNDDPHLQIVGRLIYTLAKK